VPGTQASHGENLDSVGPSLITCRILGAILTSWCILAFQSTDKSSGPFLMTTFSSKPYIYMVTSFIQPSYLPTTTLHFYKEQQSSWWGEEDSWHLPLGPCLSLLKCGVIAHATHVLPWLWLPWMYVGQPNISTLEMLPKVYQILLTHKTNTNIKCLPDPHVLGTEFNPQTRQQNISCQLNFKGIRQAIYINYVRMW
jgi:hypothetical protein